MKKKFLLMIVFIFLLFGSNAEAKTIKVISCENFSTVAPHDIYKVKTIRESKISNDFYLEPNTVIVGEVTKIHKPKRGKQDSYFEFQPKTYIYNDKTEDFNELNLNGKIKEYKNFDPTEIVFKTGLGVANFFLKGIIDVGEFVIGAYQNKYEGRIKSGVLNIYNNSFLTFIEYGKELNIKEGDVLVLKIKKIR